MPLDRLNDALARRLAASGAGCLLVVSPDVERLRAGARQLRAAHGWPEMRVGPALSARLLTVARADRPRAARHHLEELVQATAQADAPAPTPVLWSSIDLLFAPALQLDPLALVRRLGKRAPIVACWPGQYRDDVLSYAVPDHAHYRTWRHPDVWITVLP